jgi:hypothetical protein
MKINELVEGPTGFMSRLGSGLKSMLPGQAGQVGKAEGVTKMAAKKIYDQLVASSKGMGLDPNALTLRQVMGNDLFPDDRSKKVLQIAWQQLKLGKTANAKQMADLAYRWAQLYQQGKGQPKPEQQPQKDQQTQQEKKKSAFAKTNVKADQMTLTPQAKASKSGLTPQQASYINAINRP